MTPSHRVPQRPLHGQRHVFTVQVVAVQLSVELLHH
jgi:hypothetical protein